MLRKNWHMLILFIYIVLNVKIVRLKRRKCEMQKETFTGMLIIYQLIYNWYEMVQYKSGVGHVVATSKDRKNWVYC